MGFIQDQKKKLAGKALANEKVGYFREKILPELEKFLIAGPVFIGFILGLWRYRPLQPHFEVAFQSLIFFCLYIGSLIMLQFLDTLFFSSWPLILGIGRSVLAFLYLALTTRQYLEWRSGEAKLYGLTAKFRNRINLAGT